MKRPRHLPDETLLRLAKAVRPRPPAEWRSHLARCVRCAAELREVRALRAHLRRPPAEPSPGVLARAQALMEPRPPRHGEAARFALARLIYDSGTEGAAAGLRAAVEPRHQVWRTARADVDTHLEGGGLGAQAVLVGQVLPRRRAPVAESGDVWLSDAGQPVRWSSLERNGEFAMPAPRGRRWRLLIRWGRLRLRLDSR